MYSSSTMQSDIRETHVFLLRCPPPPSPPPFSLRSPFQTQRLSLEWMYGCDSDGLSGVRGQIRQIEVFKCQSSCSWHNLSLGGGSFFKRRLYPKCIMDRRGRGTRGPGSRFLAREIKTIVSLRTFIRETAGLRRKGLQTVPAKEADLEKHIHMLAHGQRLKAQMDDFRGAFKKKEPVRTCKRKV